MLYYHGKCKCKKYFEGWYFKHQDDNNMISIIPGISIDDNGSKSAFIQIITNRNSYQVGYPIKDCYFDHKRLYIKIGRNVFTKGGIKLDIKRGDVILKGRLTYGVFHRIGYDIMGPFRLIPFMACNHSIISLSHRVNGDLLLNGDKINFTNGKGYIESDWGHSFPSSYLWNQCNYFTKDNTSIILSIASIPFLWFSFTGCICVIEYKGKKIRLATYLGAKVLYYHENGCCIEQGKYRLRVEMQEKNANELAAPFQGNMSKTITESPFCYSRYRFYEGNNIIFNLISNKASMEYVNS